MTTPRAAPLSSYRTPGVRLEWLDSAQQGRTPVRTDIAGFVGIAERGPLYRPVRVEGWDQYRGVFGDHLPYAYLAYAVEGFYANGGRTCWVVRVADQDTARPAAATLPGPDGQPALELRANSEGTWGNRVSYRVQSAGPGLYTLTLRLGDVIEIWRNLGGDRNPKSLLNDPNTGSRLVSVTAAEAVPAPDEGFLAAGAEGLESLTPGNVEHGLSILDELVEVALVVAPDLWARPVVRSQQPTPRPRPCGDLTQPPQDPAPPPREPISRAEFTRDQVEVLQRSIVERCAAMGDRVALLDSPRDMADSLESVPNETSPADAILWRRKFDSPFGALYYPWPLVVDPLSANADVTAVPPSGHMAGVCAGVDQRVGVHKPPANELVALAVDAAFPVDDVAHGDLNDAGVNAIRVQRGVRVLGDRTLATSLPEWRYLNVRRLVLWLEKQIVADTVWTVFEPNTQRLWADVDRVVRAVLEEAWQRGMLNGATRNQAYSVRCDESVNPPAEVAAGRLTCLIGLNPPPPAEFVVVRVVRTASGVSVQDVPGGGGG
jgi:uncharacterized protein